MKRLLLVLLSPLVLLVPLRAQQGLPSSAAAPPPPLQAGGDVAARVAVDVWLALVDAGQYDKSWDTASGLVKKATPRDQWIKMFADHRQPLGTVVARTPKDAQSMTSLPGAPAGQYVVVRYETSFEHKKAMAETITCGLDEGGQWRVTGYFVR